MSVRAPNPRQTGRAEAPAWLASVLVHAMLVVVLGLLLRTIPRGAAEATVRTAGIVLKYESVDGDRYVDQADLAAAAATQAAAAERSLLAALPRRDALADPAEQLPSPADLFGAGPGPAAELLGPGGPAAAGHGRGTGLGGGKARVGVFGVEGVGRKFVFAFDRSVSMQGHRLVAAKAELIRSLDSLESTHQFQIIFFSHKQKIFDLSGGQRRIPFATNRCKELAARFIEGVTAEGGTDRKTALLRALLMHPDVIFFLSDADDPMSRRDLNEIQRKNRSATSINTIEFGVGPRHDRANFLVRLAAANHGKSVYVDTSALEAP